MDLDIVVKGGAKVAESHPKEYGKFEDKLMKMACGLPGVNGAGISNEPDPKDVRDPDYPPWNGRVNIIIEGGENLMKADWTAYTILKEKIEDLVEEEFPEAHVGKVEPWGFGYYQGDQVRQALAELLKDGDIISRFASAARKVRKEGDPLPDGMGMLKIEVPQAWLGFFDEYYRITGKDRREDLIENIWASIEGFMIDDKGGLSDADRARLVKKYNLQDPNNPDRQLYV